MEINQGSVIRDGHSSGSTLRGPEPPDIQFTHYSTCVREAASSEINV